MDNINTSPWTHPDNLIELVVTRNPPIFHAMVVARFHKLDGKSLLAAESIWIPGLVHLQSPESVSSAGHKTSPFIPVHLAQELDLFPRGAKVSKPAGYEFPGTVLKAFSDSIGTVWVAVENSICPGWVHVFTPKQLVIMQDATR